MENLEHKYRNNTLSASEQRSLRDKVNASSDEELSIDLYEAWSKDDIDTSLVSSEQMSNLKERIDKTIGINRISISKYLKIAQVAAAVLLPVFIVLTYYFYKETHQFTSNEMVVVTGVGEKANINLPDGTHISLNENSRLSYIPTTFNQKVRQISFDGEAYFQVHKDPKRPFIIDSKGLKVSVLGTVFDLNGHSDSDKTSLSLEEGCVKFLSTKINESVILRPGNKAVLDQNTGEITVLNVKNIRNQSAWQRGYFTFRETELSEVINTLENNYRIKIKMDKRINLSDLFTGTIPTQNMKESLLIIKTSYHFNSSQQGNTIYLYKN